MHINLFQDDEDDYLRELAYLDAQDRFEYEMWLEEENKRINKPIVKIEIRQEEVKKEEIHDKYTDILQ